MADSIGEMVIQMSVEADKVTNSLQNMQRDAERSAQKIESDFNKTKLSLDSSLANQSLKQLQQTYSALQVQYEKKIKLGADDASLARTEEGLRQVKQRMDELKSSSDKTIKLDFDTQLAKTKISELEALQNSLKTKLAQQIKINADVSSIAETKRQLEAVNSALSSVKQSKKIDIDTKTAGMKLSELKELEKQLKAQLEEKIKLNADFKDIERAKTELDAVSGKLSVVKSTAETTNSPFPAWAAGAAGAAAGIFSITAAFGVLKEAMNQAGNMEQYQASLKVMLGSTEQAKDRLQELVSFAASTPFTVPQVIALGNGLQAVGKYSKETMTNLGDLAAASGKPIEQVLGAFSKLASGQKGIAVDMFRDLLVTTNDWVDATGKGVSNSGEMLATTEEMLAALPKILAKKNFSGMMDEQSKTLKGQLSNLEDAAGQAANALGQTMLPLAKSIVSVAVPAISALKGNVELLVGVASVAGTAFVGYELAVNGVTIAKKACSVATKLLKLDMESLSAAIAANPIGLLITGIAAAGVAVYELNQAYGPTIENQRKNIDANIAANKAEQQHTQSLITAKSKTQDINAEYAMLYTQYKNAAIGSDEHKAAEQRLHSILNDQQKIYPDLIANTYDYEGGLNAMKTAAGNAVNDIRKLTGELNQQQKAMVNIQMAGANLDMSTTADKLRKDFAGVGGDNGMGAISKLLTHIQIGSKSMNEAMPELQRLQSQYAQWAAMGGKDQNFNYGVANDLTSFINAYQKKADLFKMAQSGQGISAVATDKKDGKNSKDIKDNKDIKDGKGGKEKSIFEQLKEEEIKLKKELDELNTLINGNKLEGEMLLNALERRKGVIADLNKNGINAKDLKAKGQERAAGVSIPKELSPVQETKQPPIVQESKEVLEATKLIQESAGNLLNAGIEQFSGGIARAVVEGQSLNEVFKNIGASLAEMAIQMVMMSTLKSVFAGPLGFLGIGAHSGGEFVGTSSGVMKMAMGGSFIVPPGYNNDSFPLMVESGERVSVTPAGQVNNSRGGGAELGALSNRLDKVVSAVNGMHITLMKKEFSPNIINSIDGKSIAEDHVIPAINNIQYQQRTNTRELGG